jgi:hypothetical protein
MTDPDNERSRQAFCDVLTKHALWDERIGDLEVMVWREAMAAAAAIIRAEQRERDAQIVESFDYDHMGAVAAAIRYGLFKESET